MTRRIARRVFLQAGAASVGAAVLTGCLQLRRWVILEPYVRPPEEQLAGEATWYASTCRQCPAGCGIIVRVMNGRAVKIEGNAEHPLNRGKLCARGQAGLQVLYNPDRLPGPAAQDEPGSLNYAPLPWNEALNLLAGKLQAAGGAVAVWAGSTVSGHLFDLLQRFTAAIGAPAPLVYDLYTDLQGYQVLGNVSKELFNRQALPFYNLSQADVILSFGADFLGPWHSQVSYGAEYGGFRSQPLGKRGYLVQLEPRMTMTGALADRWWPIRPGSEALVAQAIIRLIADQKLGSAARMALARTYMGNVDVAAASAASEIPMEELLRLARLYAEAAHPLALPGNVLSGREDADAAITAVQALNLVAGTVGTAGGVSLAPELPLPTLIKPQVSSFAEVQALIERMKAGQVQALLVCSANPAYDLPASAGFMEAIKQVPFVVSFSPIVDETASQAHLILPDRVYLEAWGYEVVSPNPGRSIVGSQQPVVVPVYDARSSADVLLTVARGIPAAAKVLPWADEVAYLQGIIPNLPASTFGEGGAVIWERFLQQGGWWPSAPSASAGPQVAAPAALQAAPASFQGDEQEYPYFLHLYVSDLLSDGRGASQNWLQGSPDPMTTVSWQTWVELRPQTAQKLGLKDGDIVRVTSPYGSLDAPVCLYPAIRPDTVAIPTGQGHSVLGRYARERGANPLQLVGPPAQGGTSALPWATLRVKIAPTGKRVALARFEDIGGVTKGFVNQAFPGS